MYKCMVCGIENKDYNLIYQHVSVCHNWTGNEDYQYIYQFDPQIEAYRHAIEERIEKYIEKKFKSEQYHVSMSYKKCPNVLKPIIRHNMIQYISINEKYVLYIDCRYDWIDYDIYKAYSISKTIKHNMISKLEKAQKE